MIGGMFILFLVLLLLNVPIAFSLGASSLFYLLTSNMNAAVLAQKFYAGIDSFTLLCIPGFMLAGALMNGGGITRRILNFCNAFLGHFTGSLALVNIVASMVFAGISGTAIAETVVLLSHKKADSYIHIDVEFGEGEGKIPVDSIAKRAEAYKPKEKVTYKMIKEYIEAKYGFKVHTAYIAEVKRNLGLPMYDAPNAVEELKQPRKHPTPEKVEAIKDALRYFAVI